MKSVWAVQVEVCKGKYRWIETGPFIAEDEKEAGDKTKRFHKLLGRECIKICYIEKIKQELERRESD